MARLFDSGSSEYLMVSSALPTAPPLTFACWVMMDSVAEADCFMSLGYSAANSVERIYLYQWSDGVISFTEGSDGEATGIAQATAGLTVDTWHHVCGVSASHSSRACYVDGGNKGTDSTTVTADNLDRTYIGRRRTDRAGWGGEMYMNGRIAECGIWNVALTDAEVAILAMGFSPLFVRPQNLVAYWSLIRDEDQDRVGGYDMTAYNTPGIATHPAIIYPTSPHY